MTTKHTPGPWILDKEYNVKDRQDRMIVIGSGIFGHDVKSAAFPASSGQFVADDDGGESNAALIAAAPDLLEALKECLTVVRIQNGNLHADTNEIQARAEAAIAKAEGQQ